MEGGEGQGLTEGPWGRRRAEASEGGCEQGCAPLGRRRWVTGDQPETSRPLGREGGLGVSPAEGDRETRSCVQGSSPHGCREGQGPCRACVPRPEPFLTGTCRPRPGGSAWAGTLSDSGSRTADSPGLPLWPHVLQAGRDPWFYLPNGTVGHGECCLVPACGSESSCVLSTGPGVAGARSVCRLCLVDWPCVFPCPPQTQAGLCCQGRQRLPEGDSPPRPHRPPRRAVGSSPRPD